MSFVWQLVGSDSSFDYDGAPEGALGYTAVVKFTREKRSKTISLHRRQRLSQRWARSRTKRTRKRSKQCVLEFFLDHIAAYGAYKDWPVQHDDHDQAIQILKEKIREDYAVGRGAAIDVCISYGGLSSVHA